MLSLNSQYINFRNLVGDFFNVFSSNVNWQIYQAIGMEENGSHFWFVLKLSSYSNFDSFLLLLLQCF